MEYPFVVFLHVIAGILWAGGAIAAGFFIIPAILDAGPAGGPVMAGVAKRKFPVLMTVAAVLVVLTGARLYMVRFTPGWLTAPEGIVITLGALLAVGAFAIGFFIQRPAVERMGALSAQIAASGAPPTAAQASELQALRLRLGKVAKITAWHLLGAATMMALHRFASAL